MLSASPFAARKDSLVTAVFDDLVEETHFLSANLQKSPSWSNLNFFP